MHWHFILTLGMGIEFISLNYSRFFLTHPVIGSRTIVPTTCFILHFPVSPQGLIHHVHRLFVCLFLMDLQTNVSKRAVCKRAFTVVPDSSLTSTHENPNLSEVQFQQG